MSYKDLIPGLGKRTVRERLRKLDQVKIGFPVFISQAVAKIFEYMVVGRIDKALRWVLAGLLTFLVYLYEDEIEEKASDMKDEIEEN